MAILEFVPRKAHKAFYHFASYNVVSPIHPAESLHAQMLINRFEKFFDEEIKKYSGILTTTLDNKLFEEIKPWIEEYEEWGETLPNLAKENPQKELLFKSAKSIEKVREDVRKFADHKTSIFTRKMRDFAYETLIKILVISN